MPKRVTADWMAQQWRDGKRTKKKLGAYPSMSLAQAREIFKRDFADVIQKGRSIKIATDNRPGTVDDLFEGYVARSDEHTSELQSLMRISYAVFRWKKKKLRQCTIITR